MPKFTLYVSGLSDSEAREVAYQHITLTLEGFKEGAPQPDNVETTKQRYTVTSIERAPMPGTYFVQVYGALPDVARFLKEEAKVGVVRTVTKGG